MRILVDPSTLDCLNLGDVAMLQAAVSRLLKLFPHAKILVFTNDPAMLAKHCPVVTPLAHGGRMSWLSDRDLLGRLHGLLPQSASRVLVQLKRDMRRRSPRLLETAMLGKMKITRADSSPLRAFKAALDQIDLYVVSGAATINDKAKAHARVVLATMEIAMNRGVPVVMFSQSIGPISDPELIADARRVLPRVKQVAVRESVYGPALLEFLGVSPERVFLTGDDALEMAHHAQYEANGTGIGVNLRVARSTELDDSVIDVVGGVLRAAADKYQTHLIPLPIALHAGANDQTATRRLTTAAGEPANGEFIPAGPQQVIEACGRCRIVVTSAYHAAVFALAQGIPAVCLAANVNYTQKFRGLADQFSGGCEILSVNDSQFTDRLSDAIEQAWTRSSTQRVLLRAAAARQIELSDIAYGRLAHLMVASPSPLGAAA